jgi:hypothetical protein
MQLDWCSSTQSCIIFPDFQVLHEYILQIAYQILHKYSQLLMMSSCPHILLSTSSGASDVGFLAGHQPMLTTAPTDMLHALPALCAAVCMFGPAREIIFRGRSPKILQAGMWQMCCGWQ